MYKLLPIVLLLVTVATQAQDKHFSQYFASPLTLNPAMTGKFDGTFRVTANFRNQWPGINNAFVTQTAGIDGAILRNKIQEIDRAAIGFQAYTDKNGNGILSLNGAALSVAYHKGLDEDGFHQVGIGFQGAYISRRLDITKATFADQLTTLGFTGVTSEVFTNNQINLNYFDMHAGMLYTGSNDGFTSWYLGAAFYHVNRPKESFRGANFLLPNRISVSAGTELYVNDKMRINLSGLYMTQAAANQVNIGGAVTLTANNDEYNPVNIYAGSWYRVNDAIIPYIGLEFNSIRLGFSRDFTVSNLRNLANGVNGNEFSLIYQRKPSTFKSIPCPTRF
jgi:type IX secretion system PorP/SprF family membrane protein